MKLLLYLCCVLTAACFDVRAAIITLNPNADTTISENNQARFSDGPASGSTTMIVGRLSPNGQQSKSRALLRFDLSSLPASAVITSVTVTVTVTASHLGNSDTLALHRLTTAWNETATWNHSSVMPWSGGDFADAADASRSTAGTGPVIFSSTAALLSTVRSWQTNSVENQGWILLNQDEETLANARRIATRESGARPALTIEYFVPAPPPTITIANARIEAGQFAFDFLAEAGRAYAVEYKDNLNSNQWNTLIAYPAPGADTSIRVSNSLDVLRFFRVVTD